MYILQGGALGGGASMTAQCPSQKMEENGCPPPLLNLNLAVPALNPHTRNANDRTRNTGLPEWGLTYTLYLRGHLPVIYKIFLNPIDRSTVSDPITTMVVFNSNRKYFATF